MQDHAKLLIAACIWLLLIDTGSSFQHFALMGKPQHSIPKAQLSRRGVKEGSTLFAARSPAMQTTLERTSHADQHQAAAEAAEQEYRANRGFAVDTLLQDYAALFDSPCNFDIFSEDVILRDSKVAASCSCSSEPAAHEKMPPRN